MSSQGDLFYQALKRPPNFGHLSAREQWEIDKQLGILDWDGSCPHLKGNVCPQCIKKYWERGEK